MIIKCKMCGGDMEISADQRTGTCEYCGSTMTLPRIDDEQRAAAFNRGNHFRRIGEFDKALAVYEGIVREDETDAEAHWCCALCRFGIEYVKDPATGDYLPTCHRASFDSFLEDVDYKAALEHADVVARAQYQKDGEKIAQVQRGILSISQREQPFDVFICYKESDERGNRTVDSTLAQEIYYQLTDQGRRVFFARITLEDKAGQEYEPYIFAALHSAKVMVVVGTRPEYLNAVWVRNEWSRYLTLMKHDRKRLLIPCYRDMDPYDLPEQLSVLQSYDMSKIGFIQDLIRGIAKVLDGDKKPEAVKETIIHNEMNVNLTALLKRGQQMLEDKNWEKADEFFDQVLNVDAENGEAFFGKALASMECRDIQAFIDKWSRKGKIAPKDLEVENGEKDAAADGIKVSSRLKPGKELEACPRDTGRIEKAVWNYRIPGYLSEEEIRKNFEEGKMRSYISAASIRRIFQEDWTRTRQKNKNLMRAIQYAKGEFAGQLQGIFAEIDNNLERRVEEAEKRDQEITKSLKEKYEHFLETSEKLTAEQNDLAQARREADYLAACVEEENAKDEGTYLSAAEMFEKIGNYKDSIGRVEECRKKAQEWREREEERRREEERIRKEAALRAERLKKQKNKKTAVMTSIVALTVAIIAIAAFFVNDKIIQPFLKYKEAESLLAEGNYAEAYSIFDGLRGYRDVEELLDGNKELRDAYYAVGREVSFGRYEQDGNTDNGAEDIEWLVLDRKGDTVLLLSKYGLDAKAYNEEEVGITWEQSTIRSWLNSSFMDMAFTSEEQDAILKTEVDNSQAEGYSGYNTTGGNNTEDQVFLLSYKEAFEDYFTSDMERICIPTGYAVQNGAYRDDDTGVCYWWLRSPGSFQNGATDVKSGGLSSVGVTHDRSCIRPALWVNLESGIF